MKKRIFIVAAVLFSSRLHAQDSTGRLLDEVVLTSNKYPKKQSETGKVITVINREQLDKSSGKTLGELLNTVAGTTILGANNNLGTNLTASIRGASAGNVLVLVDGIPVNDPSVNNNYFDLSFITIDQVERIEILKGGQSTLYGSDAVSGVINIIMKKPQTSKPQVFGGLAGGSYSTFKQQAAISGKAKAISYSTGYTHLSSKGFSSAYDPSGNAGFDKDGFDQHAVHARLGISLSPKLQLNASGTYSKYETDLDGAAFTDEKDYTVDNDNVQLGAGLTYQNDNGVFHFNYHFNYVERDYYDDSTYKSSPFYDWAASRYIGRTHYAEAYQSWKFAQLELLAGIDYRRNNTDQFYRSQFPPFAIGDPPFIYETSLRDKNISQWSPYASVVYNDNKGFTMELGGRWNQHSQYGSNITFTLNPSYLIEEKVKLFGNLYSSFKSPTLYQLFDPSAGNPDLEPERGMTTEAGVQWFASKAFRTRVVGFYRKTKDAIVYTFDPSTFATKYLNVSRQTNYGAELEAEYASAKWKLSANYTYTDGKITSSYDETGTPMGKDTSYFNLYRIPKHAANLFVGWQATNALYVSTQVRIVGERQEYVYGGAPTIAEAYATIDLYGEYAFGNKIKLFLDLKNITNKEYFDFPGYNSRRFNFMAGVNFNL
ncbi:MAG: TonB-dependent receptor [Chitinophagaceae bacterium]|nr:TonB-dependent receptor [Chitinophagaceae bacterium]